METQYPRSDLVGMLGVDVIHIVRLGPSQNGVVFSKTWLLNEEVVQFPFNINVLVLTAFTQGVRDSGLNYGTV